MRKFVLPALTIVVLLSACASNKKRKCNSCPKWEDRIEWTTQRAAHEEQYQPGSRP
ncbi:MAG: hypothetical protein ACK5BL_10000 [Flavobacteriales bacterium]